MPVRMGKHTASFLGLLKGGLDLPECSLAYSAAVGNPGEGR